MSIIYKSKVKHQILTNIGTAKTISKEIKECFYPVNNLFWCNELNLYEPFEEEQYITDFKMSAPLSLTKIKELLDLFYINQKLCNDYPKLQEFSYDFFKKEFYSLEADINATILGLKKLRRYKFNKELRQVVKLLEHISKATSSAYEEILIEDTHKISI